MASDYATVGGVYDDKLMYVVVDQTTGKVVFSEKIHGGALATAAGYGVSYDNRYWHPIPNW